MELGGKGLKVDFKRLDVIDPSSIDSAFSFISEKYRVLDILVIMPVFFQGKLKTGQAIKVMSFVRFLKPIPLAQWKSVTFSDLFLMK